MHRAFLWQDDCQGGTMTDLGVPDGFFDSYAYHINDNGEAVGAADIRTDCNEPMTLANYRAARWRDGNWEILHTLDTPPASAALGSNNQGQVVGQLFDSRGVTVGSFLWQKGTMYDLSTLTDNVPPYFVFARASAINDDGWIVGLGFFSNEWFPQPRAILWVPERSSHLR
jgi:probable HAF family extracellular repeat protein